MPDEEQVAPALNPAQATPRALPAPLPALSRHCKRCTPCCRLTPGPQELDAMFELVDAQARDGAADDD